VDLGVTNKLSNQPTNSMEQSSSEINNSLVSQEIPHVSWNHNSQEPTTCPYSESD